MQQDLYIKRFLNPQVLIGLILLSGIIGYFSSIIPLNNWHFSLVEYDSSSLPFFSPLSKFLADILGFDGQTIWNQDLTILSTISAVLSMLAIWILFASVPRDQQSWAIPLMIILILGAISFLAISSFALHHSLFWFGFSLLVVSNGNSQKTAQKPLLLFILNLVALTVLLGSSIAGIFIGCISIFFGSKSRNQVLLKGAAILLSIGILLSIINSYFSEIQTYIFSIYNYEFTIGSKQLAGADLPWYFPLSRILYSVPPAIIALMLPSLLKDGFSLKKNTFPKVSLIAISLGFVCFPFMGNVGGFDVFFVIPVLLVCTVQSLNSNWIASLSRKIKWAVVAFALLISTPELLQLTRMSPYQYLHSNVLGPSFKQMIVEGEGEYLNMAGLSLLKKEFEKADTLLLATNFGDWKRPGVKTATIY